MLAFSRLPVVIPANGYDGPAGLQEGCGDEPPPLRRLGFAVKIAGRPDLKGHDSRRWRKAPHLRVSLHYLDLIFAYLAEHGIRMYRFGCVDGSHCPRFSRPRSYGRWTEGGGGGMSDARQRGTTLGNRVVSASGGGGGTGERGSGGVGGGSIEYGSQSGENVAFARLVVLPKTTAGCTADGGWEVAGVGNREKQSCCASADDVPAIANWSAPANRHEGPLCTRGHRSRNAGKRLLQHRQLPPAS